MYVGSAYTALTMSFDTGSTGCFVADSNCPATDCARTAPTALQKFTSATSSTYSPGSVTGRIFANKGVKYSVAGNWVTDKICTEPAYNYCSV